MKVIVPIIGLTSASTNGIPTTPAESFAPPCIGPTFVPTLRRDWSMEFPVPGLSWNVLYSGNAKVWPTEKEVVVRRAPGSVGSMRPRTPGHNAYWKTTYDSSTGIMSVKIMGVIRREDWIEIVKDGADWGNRYNALKHLVDYSEAAVTLTVSDLYSRPSLLETSGIARSWKVALVFSESFAAAHRAFIENVAFNRGYETLVFTSVEEARRWLVSSSKKRPKDGDCDSDEADRRLG